MTPKAELYYSLSGSVGTLIFTPTEMRTVSEN